MKLVAGLGNPGPKYQRTRHNVGFWTLDELVRRWGQGAPRFERDFEALLWDVQRPQARVLLLAPQTFMNLSGRSVAAAARFYRIAPQDLLVIYDDLDLPTGRLRLRAGGSSGGHRGMEDVLTRLGTPQISRLRIGIGRPHPSRAVDHVLGPFTPQERPLVEQAVIQAADAVECWLSEGIEAAMNRFNRAGQPGSRSAGRYNRPAGSQGETS